MGEHLDPEQEDDLVRGVYRRGTDEFARAVFFSDAVFAIAMTLLVASIEVPADGPGSLAERLSDESGQIWSFFLSFAVIGYYWLAHHRLLSLVDRIDLRTMAVNLAYLGLIAFLPFPTALIGQASDSTVAVVLYASTMALASLVETVLFELFRRADALRVELTDDQRRRWLVASLVPVLVFAGSIPIAVLAGPSWALWSWVLIFVLERIVDRWGPGEDRFA